MEETEEDSNDPNLQQDLESILDELLTVGMRHKRLQWHYRSRHDPETQMEKLACVLRELSGEA